jgi:type III secretory pathway component EscS
VTVPPLVSAPFKRGTNLKEVESPFAAVTLLSGFTVSVAGSIGVGVSFLQAVKKEKMIAITGIAIFILFVFCLFKYWGLGMEISYLL